MKTVCAKDMCAGCMACINMCKKSAITIVDDYKTYNAVIDEVKCVNCGLCEKICPNVKCVEQVNPIFWKEGWALNPEIRSNASSGGIASSIIYSFIKNSFHMPLFFLSAGWVYVHQFFTVHIPKFHRCQFLQILKCMRHFLVHQIPPFTYSILKGVFGNQILKFHKNIFSSGCQKVLPECYRYKDNSRFSKSWGFFLS